MGEAPSGLRKIVLLVETDIDPTVVQYEDERDRSDNLSHKHIQSGVIQTLLTRDQLQRSESPCPTLRPANEFGGILHNIRRHLPEVEPGRNNPPSPHRGHSAKINGQYYR